MSSATGGNPFRPGYQAAPPSPGYGLAQPLPPPPRDPSPGIAGPILAALAVVIAFCCGGVLSVLNRRPNLHRHHEFYMPLPEGLKHGPDEDEFHEFGRSRRRDDW